MDDKPLGNAMQKVIAIMALQITSFVQDEQYMSGFVQEVSTETASSKTAIKGVFGFIDVWRMPRTLAKDECIRF